MGAKIMDVPHCAVCLEPYDLGRHKPMTLPASCGHSACAACLPQLLERHSCPTCRTVLSPGEQGCVNRALIEVIDQMDSLRLSSTQGRRILVFVRDLSGRSLCIHILSTASVAALKQEVESRNGIPPKQQRLIFAGKQLEDGSSLAFYGVSKECTIQLALRLLGGA